MAEMNSIDSRLKDHDKKALGEAYMMDPKKLEQAIDVNGIDNLIKGLESWKSELENKPKDPHGMNTDVLERDTLVRVIVKLQNIKKEKNQSLKGTTTEVIKPTDKETKKDEKLKSEYANNYGLLKSMPSVHAERSGNIYDVKVAEDKGNSLTLDINNLMDSLVITDVPKDNTKIGSLLNKVSTDNSLGYSWKNRKVSYSEYMGLKNEATAATEGTKTVVKENVDTGVSVNGKVETHGGALRVRSDNGEVIGKLNNGTPVELLEKGSIHKINGKDSYKIKFQGKIRYVAKDFIKLGEGTSEKREPKKTEAKAPESTKPQDPKDSPVRRHLPERRPAKAPEAKAPEAKAPEAKAPEAKAPEAKAPEVKAPEVKAPEVKAPEAKAPVVPNEDESPI